MALCMALSSSRRCTGGCRGCAGPALLLQLPAWPAPAAPASPAAASSPAAMLLPASPDAAPFPGRSLFVGLTVPLRQLRPALPGRTPCPPAVPVRSSTLVAERRPSRQTAPACAAASSLTACASRLRLLGQIGLARSACPACCGAAARRVPPPRRWPPAVRRHGCGCPSPGCRYPPARAPWPRS